jgi:putrescine importer
MDFCANTFRKALICPGTAVSISKFISSMINFGALIAFTVVNLTVIVFYAFRMKQRRTPKEIFTNIVLPFVGMCLTGMLWVNLHFDALMYGAIWLTIGIIVLI